MQYLLTRHPDEGIELRLAPEDTSADELLDALKRGGIRVRITAVQGTCVRIGVESPVSLRMERFVIED